MLLSPAPLLLGMETGGREEDCTRRWHSLARYCTIVPGTSSASKSVSKPGSVEMNVTHLDLRVFDEAEILCRVEACVLSLPNRHDPSP